MAGLSRFDIGSEVPTGAGIVREQNDRGTRRILSIRTGGKTRSDIPVDADRQFPMVIKLFADCVRRQEDPPAPRTDGPRDDRIDLCNRHGIEASAGVQAKQMLEIHALVGVS